jgi:tetratricopeptide (TPR) repeat protein
MALLLSVIPGAFFLWLLYKFGRFIFRRLFFKKLVAKHTRARDTKPVLAMATALENNEQASFYDLADSATQADLRALVARGDVADHEGRIAVFRGYARNNPKNAKGQYLYGVYLIRKAWDARGGGYADTVSESARQDFASYLDDAQEVLQRAIELDPTLADAYAELLIVYKGQSSKHEAAKLFDEASKRFPTHIEIHHNMVTLLDERWLGRADEAIEFARKHSNNDSTGTLASLIPIAHFEKWVGSDTSITEFFKDKPVRKEIKEAFKRFKSSPQTQENETGRLNALQFFALAFDIVYDTRSGRKAFKLMKGRYSNSAWKMWKNPEEKFVRAKWQTSY